MPNTPLRPVPRESMPEDLQAAFDRSMELRGDATFFEVFANHPDLYRWYTKSFYGEVFYGGLVDTRIKELVRFRLSTIHGCRFCNQGNRVAALEAGLSEEDVDAVGNYEGSSLAPREKAALRLADQMLLTNPGGVLDDALYRELREYYSNAEILELGVVLGVLAGMAKFLFAFDLVEKEADCPIHPKM